MTTRTRRRVRRRQEAAMREPVIPARGYPRRGGGAAAYIDPPAEWRATTVQACGMWPFATGASSPMIGVPLGRNLMTGATVCGDPISWFQRARLISNPSAFVIGLPGLGKSTLVRRMMLGSTGFGAIPIVVGDLKPDHVELVRALGGQLIELGRGRGRLNVLDVSEATEAAGLLTGRARAQVIADARSRRHTMVSTLISLVRGSQPTDHEETLIDRALAILDTQPGVPVLADLLAVINARPVELQAVAFDRGEATRYLDQTEPLVKSLTALLGGRLGELFAAQTTTRMDLDRPVVFDVSSIDDTDLTLQAACLMACWSVGFGNVNIANALADAGLRPRRPYLVVLDELWRVLRAGRGMTERVDVVTRVNRTRGVGVIMVTHTISDLEALPSQEDRVKARGFIERAGMVVCGGIPEGEVAALGRVIAFSTAEREMVTSWQSPPSMDDIHQAPPGQGNFLIKIGTRPGVPFHLTLTDIEQSGFNDTNKRWHA